MSWSIPLEILSFRFINLKIMTVLAYSFRDSKSFALLI